MNTEPLPEIDHDEYKDRTRRIQAEMEARNYDALLITSEDNFQYLTGYRGPVWHNLTRPRYLVVGRTGDPCMITTSNHIIIAEETSWISDIRTWVAPNPEDDGVSLVIDALKSCLGSGKTIAAELGTQSRLSMPCGDFMRIRDEMADVKFIDGHELMMSHRMVKSAAEIARIKRAAQATSRGFQQVPDFANAGMTLRSVTQELKMRILEAGADDIPYVTGVAESGGYPCVSLAPDRKTLEPGDVFVIDVAARFEGYYCDFDRDFMVGRANDGIADNYRRVWDATEAGIAAVKPNARLSDVWLAMADVLGIDTVRSTGIGRMGHGIGLRMCEEPSVSETSDTVIEENMVLTLEPGIVLKKSDASQRDNRILVHEENLVVTQKGAELISTRAPQSITSVNI